MSETKLIPELLTALKAAQFGFAFQKCPVCAGWDVGPNGETPLKHRKDCILARAIARAERHIRGGR